MMEGYSHCQNIQSSSVQILEGNQIRLLALIGPAGFWSYKGY